MTTPEPHPKTAQIRIEDLSDLTEIGRGAAATVYRCTRPDGSPAAVKIFNAVVEDDAAADQYRREHQALGRLPRHTAIISMEGRGRTGDGRPFILLELTERSLRTMVTENGPMPWEHAIRLAVTLAGALETAHRIGVVHCDVGPANVHRIDGRWKLADFGASCDGRGDVGDTGRPFTLDHAAPEAIRGAPGAVGRDVYGLASTLFHALAGEAPFGEVRHRSAEDIARRIATEPAPDLRPAGVPDALCQVIERAMSKDPGLRPASAGELADDLASAAGQLGVHVVPPLVLAPVTADLTAAPPGIDLGPAAPTVEAPPRPARTGGRFAPILVGVAAAALAVGAAVPVITDAIDDGPSSLVLADQPTEVALGAVDTDDSAPSDTADEPSEIPAADPETDADTADTADGGVDGNENDGGAAGGGNGGGGDGAATAPAAQPVAANAGSAAGAAGGDGEESGGGGGGGGGRANDRGRGGNGGGNTGPGGQPGN